MAISFVKSPFVCGKFHIFGNLMKHNYMKHMLINSPVNRHPPYVSLVSAYGNNSCKRTVLLMDTQFPWVSTYKKVDCSRKTVHRPFPHDMNNSTESRSGWKKIQEM